MMDLLSGILRDLRLRSAVLSLGEFRAPWGLDKGPIAGAPFHLVIEGRCLLEIENGEVVELSPGDLAVLPHGHRHALLSDRDAPRTPFARVLEAHGIKGLWRPGLRVERLDRIRLGGTGPLTRIVNGVFAFGDRRRNPLLDSLPPVIRVRGREGRPASWLEPFLAVVTEELTAGLPGFQTIVERLADVIFVQAVRDHVASRPTNGRGWLRGLTDPHIARALALVHERPGHAWTVASLAQAAALSRTVFAHRFRTLVGSTVMGYVAARRMHVAAGLLAGSDDALAGIAQEVGYESEISFSKAFRRWGGIPPGRYRRVMREVAPDDRDARSGRG